MEIYCLNQYIAINMDEIEKLGNRLKKIGINVMFAGNYPYIYLDTVNGVRVKEIYYSNHYFCIALLPIKNDNPIRFTNIRKMFEVIRDISNRNNV